MLEQPDSPTTGDTKRQVFDHYLYRLQSEIHTIIECEQGYEERIKSLENDLSVFKRACFTSENEKRLLTEEVNALRGKLDALENKKTNMEKRIVCLIDGDGTVFSSELIAQGQEGGRLAAKQLSESVHFHLQASANPCHLWTYVFFNKRGLMDTFARAGATFREAREHFDDFIQGFNQSSERFVMVDVGTGKEAADAKIKAHLDYYAHSPETSKIVFGGCHDNGYVPQLHSLLTSVYRDKLVLLPGYSEMATEITKLQLPSLVIPGLFLAQKIACNKHGRQSCESLVNSASANNLGPPPGLPPPSTSSTEEIEPPSTSSTPPPPPPYPRSAESVSTADSEQANTKTESSPKIINSVTRPTSPQRVVLGHVSGPVSYRSAVQSGYNQSATESQMNAVSRSTLSKGAVTKQRRINPNIPLSQHDPPPCTLFYLATNGCKHGADCRFGHDYILDPDDYEAMRINAKKVPCPAANRGEICVFGDNCCYGHQCPFLTRCAFYKQGKCKFSGVNMHREV